MGIICEKCKEEIKNQDVYPRYRAMSGMTIPIKSDGLGGLMADNEYYLCQKCEKEIRNESKAS